MAPAKPAGYLPPSSHTCADTILSGTLRRNPNRGVVASVSFHVKCYYCSPRDSLCVWVLFAFTYTSIFKEGGEHTYLQIRILTGKSSRGMSGRPVHYFPPSPPTPQSWAGVELSCAICLVWRDQREIQYLGWTRDYLC